MSQDLRLPQNNKEGLLYGVIICSITALLMTSFNTYLQLRMVNIDLLVAFIKVFPLFFIVAMLLENFIIHFARKMVTK